MQEKDILAGKITNVATVTGKDPDGKTVKTEDTEEVTTDLTNPDQVKPVTPNAKVTQTPATGYEFAGWLSDNASVQGAVSTFADVEAIRSVSFHTDTVFNASIKTAGNDDNGDDENNGGGSSSDSSGRDSRSSAGKPAGDPDI